MPATSPTLSPTLSAITAGLRGSSSGIPASTLPTRSAPMSAALVKIPPPTLANRAIDEPPSATAVTTSAQESSPSSSLETRKARPTPSKPRPATGESHDRPAPEGNGEGGGSPTGPGRLRGPRVGSSGDPHPDVAGATGEEGAEHEGHRPPGPAPIEKAGDEAGHDHDEDQDPGVLAVEKGHRPLSDRIRDLDHLLVAAGMGQDRAGVESSEDEGGDGGEQRRIDDQCPSSRILRNWQGARSVGRGAWIENLSDPACTFPGHGGDLLGTRMSSLADTPGLCEMHYRRLLRTGELGPPGPIRQGPPPVSGAGLRTAWQKPRATATATFNDCSNPRTASSTSRD